MKLTPLHDRIVIKEDEAEEVSQGGIVLVDQEKPATGTVIATGPGKYAGTNFVPVTVKEGDKIVFTRNAGEIVELNGEDFRIIQDDFVIGIIT